MFPAIMEFGLAGEVCINSLQWHCDSKVEVHHKM